MKKYILLFLVLSPISILSQQGRNIDLDEVINTSAAIPTIYIDSLLYSMRERDQMMSNLLKSQFWLKSFKLRINLQDYETDRKYLYESKGKVRIIINDIELTQKHQFKTSQAITNLLENSTLIQVVSSSETLRSTNYLGDDPATGQTLYISDKKNVPVTLVKIKSDLSTETVYNKPNNRRKLKKLSDFKVISDTIIQTNNINPSGASYTLEQVKTVKLDNVEVVQDVEEDGIVYSPVLVNGQITFKKNAQLTRLNKKKEKYLKMGLNEWGIDLNANTWAQALRVHLGGKMTSLTTDGLPILFGMVTLGDEQPGPLWVIDGVYLSEPPASVRSLVDIIREVNVLKYNGTARYGSRGAAGVIEIQTTLSTSKIGTMNYNRSFEVKGKKNIALMQTFQSFERQFISKRDSLKKVQRALIEINEPEKVDSIQDLLNVLEYKSYLFTANFAINNADSNIAPYLAITKIADAQIPILESIDKKLSPKVKNSKYGKKFTKLLDQRKQRDSINK